MPASPMSFFRWSTKFQRAFALSAVVLATGGLVLYKTPTAASAFGSPALAADGKNAVSFSGPGAHGVMALSHTALLRGAPGALYADIRLVGDNTERAAVRAPISLAVVLDTSGSMGGDKIEDAKRSVLRLVADMRDEDEIAVVTYSEVSEVVQPLARLGTVRQQLTSRIQAVRAAGGTNIPSGLSQGRNALESAGKGRVRRIVLVSDGLDNTRAQAESIALSSFGSGITVSSLGIGLDFDESYMGAVAQSGHGNFAFIKDGGSLASFLKRELDQTATTTVENAKVRIPIPRGLRFVAATGADATYQDGELELNVGSIFAGDERRIIVELAADDVNDRVDLRATVSWNLVGASKTNITVPVLSVVASSDPAAVERGRDGAVLASTTSVLSSKRQLEAANAFARGDVARATQLTTQNEAALGAALAAAPAAAAPGISAQMDAYSKQKEGFARHRPSSVEGKSITKAAAVSDLDNLSRASKF